MPVRARGWEISHGYLGGAPRLSLQPLHPIQLLDGVPVGQLHQVGDLLPPRAQVMDSVAIEPSLELPPPRVHEAVHQTVPSGCFVAPQRQAEVAQTRPLGPVPLRGGTGRRGGGRWWRRRDGGGRSGQGGLLYCRVLAVHWLP